jgi:hypothetical protein
MLLRQRYSALLGGHSMIKIASLSVAGALLACGLSAAPAHAANRTWVSGKGTDSGACALAAPCRTFAFALTQTAAGGEIDVLDPAGYGITKSISIVNDGVGVAAIETSSGNGVTINGGPSDSIHLRGLTIEGLGNVGNESGILFNTGGNLAIENCVFRGLGIVGINIAPTTSSSFSVSNTIASNNGIGIYIGPTGSATVTGVISKVITDNNSWGIGVGGALTAGAVLNVTIVDSEASNNRIVGVYASSSSRPADTAVMLRNVVASYNGGAGLVAYTNGTLRVAHSVVTGNGNGVRTFGGGTLDSYGDNNIDGNFTDNTGVLTVIPTH